MGKKTERVNISLPIGMAGKARDQGLSMSGILRTQLREKLILSDEEIERYRSCIGRRRK
jgi:post-segregation antitoxin (ccd killing protein)